ncbi:hypothetical protein KCP75_14370 [Salmonella enterica subsp. enterica]|nr:hypothetical protein KCP75_14370 [Salmonella enterica subsp. enterica]
MTTLMICKMAYKVNVADDGKVSMTKRENG